MNILEYDLIYKVSSLLCFIVTKYFFKNYIYQSNKVLKLGVDIFYCSKIIFIHI